MKYALTLVAFLVGLAFLSTPTVRAEPDREPAAPLVMKGTVQSVDLEAKTFILGGERESKAKFVAGDGVSLAELKAGAKVAVTYTKSGETLTATKIVPIVAPKPPVKGEPEPDRAR